MRLSLAAGQYRHVGGQHQAGRGRARRTSASAHRLPALPERIADRCRLGIEADEPAPVGIAETVERLDRDVEAVDLTDPVARPALALLGLELAAEVQDHVEAVRALPKY